MISIIIIYDYFYPAYKAGGPVQSLLNLMTELNGDYQRGAIAGAFDLNSKTPLEGVELNCWNSITMADNNTFDVWYDSGKTNLTLAISNRKPNIIYLNGIFSFSYVIKPLLICQTRGNQVKPVLCPRGMLQRGALSLKPLKKKLYLSLLKLSGLLKNVRWHATNEEEKEDIKRVFGKQADIVVAPNIPKKPVSNPELAGKEAGRLKLVYLSLIAEKKNLLQAIDLVNNANEGVTLDIYGPIKDEKYWQMCKRLIGKNSQRIVYKGDVQPKDVQNLLGHYHALISLTKGENFGHALYESLSVGRPLITSYFTPWNELEGKKAGWNMDIKDNQGCLQKLKEITRMSGHEFESYCKGAYSLAKEYYKNLNAKEKYNELFKFN